MKNFILTIALFIGITTLTHAQTVSCAPASPLTLKINTFSNVTASIAGAKAGVAYSFKWILPDGTVVTPATIRTLACSVAGAKKYYKLETTGKDASGKVVYSNKITYEVDYVD